MIRSKQLLKGPKTKEFEKAFGEYIGVNHVTSTSSDTATLTLSIRAFGIGPGDEVIVPTFSSLVTPNPAVYSSAVSVLANVDEKTLNMSANDFWTKISEGTKAVILVNIYGCPGDIYDIIEIAGKKGISVIEDVAFLMKAEYKNK